MKGFKHTGKGPRYGDFNFSTKSGFSSSSGKVKQISGYTRRSPMKKAVGGLASSEPFKGKNQGFSEGGAVRSAKKALGAAITEKEAKAILAKSPKPSDSARTVTRKILGSAITDREFKRLKGK